jgi:hypothetical protein
VICLMFSVLVGLVVVACLPKAIPHCVNTPLVHNHTTMHYLSLICTKMYIVT